MKIHLSICSSTVVLTVLWLTKLLTHEKDIASPFFLPPNVVKTTEWEKQTSISTVYNRITIKQDIVVVLWRRQWHPLQFSCLENPMGGGAWWAAVHGVAKSQTRLSDFSFTFHFPLSCIGEGNGNPLQCSCLENPRDGEPRGLPSLGSHRVRHDWSDLAVAVGTSWRLGEMRSARQTTKISNFI